ncbi:hypothetical protein CONLIGDRAFT_631896 [Coniochaeta ligniaria NRRL 30616]|uniref:CNH domain-containing protein n=1 Tax=Coniochaeta ligniaria NRRL 30616 TaxID=1408157 RepID=A0A1J7JJ40_9PEZI|nr:hypothetical protein CONLIGDRAFT_631896 [Coniochaeta ligniaria NRRL 30616]
MDSESQSGATASAAGTQQSTRPALETGPFVLRPLLQDVPLSAEGTDEDIKINCVDYHDGNLYVGTSASELLHFFQVPPDPDNPSAPPTFILASRLQPAFVESLAILNGSRPGVQQVLLLPRVGKAVVLCNWTVTFYSLPELSPAFNNTQVKNCNWIGGIDLNEGPSNSASGGVNILLSMTRRVQVVRIGDDARLVRKIDFAGSTLSVRRDSIACVADSRSYALLDVDRQLKIPLMSISSLDNSQPGGPMGQVQDIAGGPDGGLSRSASSAQSRPLLAPQEHHGHGRSTSLGNFITGGARRHEKRASEVDDNLFQDPDPPAPSRSPRPAANQASKSQMAANKPLPTPPTDAASSLIATQASISSPARTASPGALASNLPPRIASPANTGALLLKPLIVSPTPEEFLIVTGTGPLDPGIGMFVNLDGDPTRPTVEFSRYPQDIVVDGGSSDLSASKASVGEEPDDGYVLASLAKEFEDGMHYGLEIQRFDVNVGEDESAKHWLEPTPPVTNPLGVRSLLSSDEMHFQEVADRLCRTRFSPFAPGRVDNSAVSLRSVDSRTALSMERMSNEKELFEHGIDSDEEPLPDGWETVRNREEKDFVARFTKTSSRLAVWSGDIIWWAVRNPLLLQLEACLEGCTPEGAQVPDSKENWAELLSLLNLLRGREPKTELEFMTLSYIRQKGSVMLLTSFLRSPGPLFTDSELNAMEEILLEGGIDPRVILAMIPPLRNEIVESRKGIWIFAGVKAIVEDLIAADRTGSTTRPLKSLDHHVVQFLRRFLTAYRRQKGFGSIADENDVFRTVDAALLLVLLELDQGSPRGPAGKSGPVRHMLYELVDHGVDCFDRAVDLLESYHRLFVLSRLYQSRKMSSEVLATWKRIIEGERDDGGELGDGEQQVRSYLSKISSQALVREYGIWLANRNPKLGVQVFADDKGKAPKFEPTQVVALLREEAPDAVKYYLEHLVFGKGHTAYVNELINYYLDIVITNLQSSAATRETITTSYEAYRALRPPKPTYRQFITDNAPPDDEVWHSRLRLLQLLGGAHEYDSKTIRERITSAFHTAGSDDATAELLVPEVIILDGRERQHEDALRLLVHRLGDYDTAVSYCLRGGSSIYTPTASRRGSMPSQDTQTHLFRVLLREFMALEDVSDRVEQTGTLLERFGGWFDVLEVLDLLPDGWSVDIAAEFLVSALRRLVREKHESMLERALSSAQNLRVNYDLLVKIDEKGPIVDLGQ